MKDFWAIAGFVLLVSSILSLLFSRAEGIAGSLFGAGIICLVLSQTAGGK
jgi:hypothetical protein